MPRYDLALFDLDGVLVDSRANMEAAWAHVRERCDLDIPFERYFAEIGLPFGEILVRLRVEGDYGKIAGVFSDGSLARFGLIRPYEGAEAMLEALTARGVRIGVVTSKDAQRTGRALGLFRARFDAVCPPRPNLAGKPAPDQLLAAADEAGVAPERAVYVGDMTVDLEAARNAGMAYAHADWGYGAPLAGSDFVAEDPARLAELLLA